MDPISDALTAIRVESGLRAQLDVAARLDSKYGYFGIVSRGTCSLNGDAGNAGAFAEGDCFLLAPGVVSHLHGDSAAIAGVRFTFDQSGGKSFADLLPPVIAVRAGHAENAMLRTTLGLLDSEMAAPAAGSQAAIQRLADVFLIHAIRSHLESNQGGMTTWLEAVRDPQIGAALRAMHQRMEHPWTVMALAAEAGMSRSSFAQRFKDLIGEAPLEYLTRWRMKRAGRLLRDETRKLFEVATSVGYDSDGAFHKAFKRVHGVTPGAYRRNAARV